MTSHERVLAPYRHGGDAANRWRAEGRASSTADADRPLVGQWRDCLRRRLPRVRSAPGSITAPDALLGMNYAGRRCAGAGALPLRPSARGSAEAGAVAFAGNVGISRRPLEFDSTREAGEVGMGLVKTAAGVAIKGRRQRRPETGGQGVDPRRAEAGRPRRRISRRAGGNAAPGVPAAIARWRCGGDPVVTSFFDAVDTGSLVRAASGTKYAASDGRRIWIKGDSAVFRGADPGGGDRVIAD